MFELSEYQKNIIEYVKNEKGNLLIEAKAGSGKTSTLLLIADELIKQNKQSLFIAFSKNIVKELQKKINNSNCMVRTLHSTGSSFIYSYLYKKYGKDKFYLDSDQYSSANKILIQELFEKECKQNVIEANSDLSADLMKDLIHDMLIELIKFVDYCRFYMIDFNDEEAIEDFVHTVPVRLEYINNYKRHDLKLGKFISLVINTIIDRFENPEYDEKLGKYIIKISFTDMVFLPVYLNMKLPYSLSSYLDYVEVDERTRYFNIRSSFYKEIIA